MQCCWLWRCNKKGPRDSSLVVTKWDAVWLMSHIIKPTRSSNLLSWILLTDLVTASKARELMVLWGNEKHRRSSHKHHFEFTVFQYPRDAGIPISPSIKWAKLVVYSGKWPNMLRKKAVLELLPVVISDASPTPLAKGE